ncbi:hypothetical protein ABT052_05245 [Streptomyces sp. NPDC002766]|jgi:hypothetical protein|uniref:hypothetical protein n=1 Tax=unclassified Streptomyces TaxID=2593676 RepID=UPI0033300981
MHWGVYEVFSVLSGVVLLVCGLMLPNVTVKDRAWSVIGGAFLLVYGVYVAKQTSGTYYFPVGVFIIPAGAVIYLLAAAFGATGSAAAGGRDDGE